MFCIALCIALSVSTITPRFLEEVAFLNDVQC
jgi:hypothetical protein